MYIGEESLSLLGFLEWLASTEGLVRLFVFVSFGLGYCVYSMYALWIFVASQSIACLLIKKKISLLLHPIPWKI